MRFLVPVILLACSPVGCTPAQEPESQPAGELPEVTITHPLDGDAVTDTVTVRLAITTPTALHRLALIVDGRCEEERYRPPWGFIWDAAALPDSSWHRLHVAAADASGHGRLCDSCRVLVCANSPPAVEILWPPSGRWFDLEQPGRDWQCRATDPDEGPLPAEQIEWRLDDAVIAGAGSEIAPPSLTPGEHRVAVRAVDRWGRSSADTVTIHAFRYPGAGDPAGALETFLCALRAGDTATAIAQLAPGFASCTPGSPSPWQATGWQEEAAALGELLDPDHLLSLSLAANASRPETLTWRGRRLAQIELSAFDLHARWRCLPERAGGAVRDLRIDASGARVGLAYLADSSGTQQWRLRVWRDLHGACWQPRAGLSWSEVKRISRERRICR